MFKIWLGLILVLLNYNIMAFGHVLDVLPDFIGYFLIFLELRFSDIQNRSRLQIIAGSLGIYTLVTAILNFMNLKVSIVDTIANVVFIVLMVYLVYQLSVYLSGNDRKTITVMAIMLVSLIMENLSYFTFSWFYLICLLVNLVSTFIYLNRLYVFIKKTK